MTGDLRRAVEAMASAVKKVEALCEKPAMTPEEATHVAEFLPQMEDLLIDQMATSVTERSEQERILTKYELDRLLEPLLGEEELRRTIEEELDG